MNFFYGMQSQLSCMWEATASQTRSLCKETLSTLINWHCSVECYTDQAAQYIFAVNRSAKLRNSVLQNFVTPLLITISVTYLVNTKAAICVTIAAAIYTMIMAKRKGYYY
jgi:hypothetical protein